MPQKLGGRRRRNHRQIRSSAVGNRRRNVFRKEYSRGRDAPVAKCSGSRSKIKARGQQRKREKRGKGFNGKTSPCSEKKGGN